MLEQYFDYVLNHYIKIIYVLMYCYNMYVVLYVRARLCCCCCCCRCGGGGGGGGGSGGDGGSGGVGGGG